MENKDIAEVFARMAELLEIQDGNPFRIRSFQRAAQIIEDLGFEAEEAIRKQPEKLKAVHGIGSGTLSRLKQIVDTGTCDELEKLSQEIPLSLLEWRKLRNFGPKKIKLVWSRLGITTVEELEAAAQSQRLRELPGIGARSEVQLLEAIESYRRRRARTRLDHAIEVSESLIEHLRAGGHVQQIEAAGSVRRWKESIGDIDILVTSSRPEEVMQRFAEHPEVGAVLAMGSTKSSVRLSRGLSCDLRVVEDQSFGAAMQYFTGSKAHNIVLRERAKRMGYRISEYGLFLSQDDSFVVGGDEAEIYGLLELEYIPPELRENRGEIEAAEEKGLPNLIEESDFQGELHSHTSASDGKNSLSEMAAAARSRGYQYLAITDHSKALAMIGGLDEEQLLAQIQEIEKFNRKDPGIQILSGVEVDILGDGQLDIDDEVLAQLDVVVASVHSRFDMEREEMTDRICRALENPHVNILGHPTGRIFGKRDGYPLDFERVLEAARRNRVCMEINAHPKRLDLDDVHSRMAKEAGVLLSVNCDSHRTEAFQMLRYGVRTARRGWLESKDVINTYPPAQLKRVLRKES